MRNNILVASALAATADWYDSGAFFHSHCYAGDE